MDRLERKAEFLIKADGMGVVVAGHQPNPLAWLAGSQGNDLPEQSGANAFVFQKGKQNGYLAPTSRSPCQAANPGNCRESYGLPRVTSSGPPHSSRIYASTGERFPASIGAMATPQGRSCLFIVMIEFVPSFINTMRIRKEGPAGERNDSVGSRHGASLSIDHREMQVLGSAKLP